MEISETRVIRDLLDRCGLPKLQLQLLVYHFDLDQWPLNEDPSIDRSKFSRTTRTGFNRQFHTNLSFHEMTAQLEAAKRHFRVWLAQRKISSVSDLI